MPDRTPAALVEEMRRYIREQVAGGFLDAGDIEQAAVEVFADDPNAAQLDPAMLQRIAGVETDKAFAEQLEAQRSWHAVTGCDRLDSAFADLDRSGFVARQNFTCCQTCGHAEIGEEIAMAEESGTQAIGYTFFHQQSTEGAVSSGDLYLYYGSLEGDEAASVRVGRTVAQTLQRRGLTVDWNGSLDTAILVKLSWQRRVTQEMARRGMRTP